MLLPLWVLEAGECYGTTPMLMPQYMSCYTILPYESTVLLRGWPHSQARGWPHSQARG